MSNSSSPSQSTWLWEIRLKIMRFLISRYGTRAAPAGAFSDAEPESSVPLRFAVDARPITPANPPPSARNPEQLRELLPDIHKAVSC